MKYIWDTSILLHFIRESAFFTRLNEDYRLISSANQSAISFITAGEILSLKYQLNWGDKKTQKLDEAFRLIPTLPIQRKSILQAYALIDAYSQGKLNPKPLPDGMTARNMGKNDIWIAATAHVTEATIITLDTDFDHLNHVFINVIRPEHTA